MEDSAQDAGIPERIRRLISLSLTVIAAVLYAGVLGSAVVRTALQESPHFSQNTVRAAGLLSGLVGSVVTAGFARSPRPGTVQLANRHPLGGRTPVAWQSLRPPSLLRRNLAGLASVLGLETEWRALRSSPDGADPPMIDSHMPATAWVALLYFAVYFVTGVGAFAVAMWKDPVAEFLANSGWVWVGTAISTAYAFLGLNTRD